MNRHTDHYYIVCIYFWFMYVFFFYMHAKRVPREADHGVIGDIAVDWDILWYFLTTSGWLVIVVILGI